MFELRCVENGEGSNNQPPTNRAYLRYNRHVQHGAILVPVRTSNYGSNVSDLCEHGDDGDWPGAGCRHLYCGSVGVGRQAYVGGGSTKGRQRVGRPDNSGGGPGLDGHALGVHRDVRTVYDLSCDGDRLPSKRKGTDGQTAKISSS